MPENEERRWSESCLFTKEKESVHSSVSLHFRATNGSYGFRLTCNLVLPTSTYSVVLDCFYMPVIDLDFPIHYFQSHWITTFFRAYLVYIWKTLLAYFSQFMDSAVTVNYCYISSLHILKMLQPRYLLKNQNNILHKSKNTLL